jgi:spermidine synthase
MEMWFSEFHTPDVKHSIRVNRQLYSKQSDYQRIDIFETPEFGRVLTLDGNVMLTERDEFIYGEMITHAPMTRISLAFLCTDIGTWVIISS